jgi:hypothetical protein
MNHIKAPSESPSIMKRDSTINSSQNLHLNVEKEGYLFQKIDQKWIRKYCILKDNVFSFVHSKSLNDSITFSTLHCLVKVNTIDDRRFCFDIQTSREDMLLTFQGTTSLM